MATKSVFSFLLAAALSLPSASAAFTCTESDATCSALADLYSAVTGWTDSNWIAAAGGTAIDYCSFDGVSCDTSTPPVVVSLCVLFSSRGPQPLSRTDPVLLADLSTAILSLAPSRPALATLPR